MVSPNQNFNLGLLQTAEQMQPSLWEGGHGCQVGALQPGRTFTNILKRHQEGGGSGLGCELKLPLVQNIYKPSFRLSS